MCATMRIIIYSLECQRENGAGYDDGVHGVPDVAEVGPRVEDEAKVQDLQKKENKKENDRGVGAGGSVVQTGMGGISHTGVLRATDGLPPLSYGGCGGGAGDTFLSAAPLLLCKVGWGYGQGGGKKK